MLSKFLPVGIAAPEVVVFLTLATSPTFGVSPPLALDDGLTLDSALAEARRTHPLLEVTRQSLVAAEARLNHAGRRENPTFSLELENVPFSSSPDYDFDENFNLFAFVNQPLGLWSKRGRRMDVARAEIETARANLNRSEREVAYRVSTAFAAANRDRESLRLLEQGTNLWEGLVERNRIRVAEGFVAEGELIRSRVEALRYDHSVRLARQTFDRALIELVQSMGLQDFEQLPELAELQEVSSSIHDDRTRLEADLAAHRRTVTTRPEVRVAQSRLAEREAQWRLETVALRPDPTAMFGYKRNGLHNTLLIGTTIPLPLLYRNQGSSAAAAAEVAASRAELDWSVSQAKAELEIAIRGYISARARFDSLDGDFVEQAQESLTIAEAAYREGAVELIHVVDAQRARRGAHRLYLDAEYDLWVARFALTRVSGLSIDSSDSGQDLGAAQ